MTNSGYSKPVEEGPGVGGYAALVIAWAIPGAGHFAIGQKGRALVFAITIHGLFALGMLIGGLRSINPPEQAIWTYTQYLTGWPMLVANYFEKEEFDRLYVDHGGSDHRSVMEKDYEENRPTPNDDSRRDEREQYAKDFIAKHPLFAYHPKVQDIGAVYCGIAGMLNLLVVFDVLLRITGSKREVPAKRKEAFAGSDAAIAKDAA